jgi:hypothetical protein
MEDSRKQPGAPLDENDRRRLVLRLITRLSCPQCGRLYDADDFALVHRWQDIWVLSTRCRHCDEKCHVVVYMHLEAEPEPVGDLTPEELEAADEWPPISADDVLDVHTALQGFDGDFEELFDY